MTSEKSDVPGTVLTRDHVGEQHAGHINSIAPNYPTGGVSSSTSGHVYAYDRSAHRGISRPNNTTAAPPPPPYAAAPPPYPGRGPPAPAGGNVYAHDQPNNTTAAPPTYPGRGPRAHDRPGMQSNVVVMQQPGPRIIRAHPDPVLEAEYDDLLYISICICCCCSCTIGIVAVLFSLQARKAARLGLMDKAKRYANSAKGWMVATVIVVWIMLVMLVLIIAS